MSFHWAKNTEAAIECPHCEVKNYVHLSDYDVKSQRYSNGDRKMGDEFQYSINIQLQCVNCENNIAKDIIIYEYPEGVLESIVVTKGMSEDSILSCFEFGKSDEKGN